MNQLEYLRNTGTAFTDNGLHIEVDYGFNITQDDILDWTNCAAFGSAAMRVYKFISSKYGLKALREQRLKISEVDSLNDPFDLLPFDLSNPAIRQWLVGERSKIGKSFGLLCFSKQWQNFLLWTHYAEGHRGLCLGFY